MAPRHQRLYNTIVATGALLGVIAGFVAFAGLSDDVRQLAKDAVTSEPYTAITDATVGEDLPERGVGAAGDTTYPRYKSTRYETVWKPSEHWSPRGLNDVDAIVVHVAAVRPDQCEGLANYGVKNDRNVSWHFSVCDGKVYQHVELGDAAHHAGRWGTPTLSNPVVAEWWQQGINPNLRTIGIETALTPGYNIDDYQAMKDALIELLAWLVEEADLPADRVHIIGHFETDGTNRAVDPICCMDLDGIVAEVAQRVGAPTEPDITPPCCECGEAFYSREQALWALDSISWHYGLQAFGGEGLSGVSDFSTAVLKHLVCVSES